MLGVFLVALLLETADVYYTTRKAETTSYVHTYVLLLFARKINRA